MEILYGCGIVRIRIRSDRGRYYLNRQVINERIFRCLAEKSERSFERPKRGGEGRRYASQGVLGVSLVDRNSRLGSLD